MLSITTRGLTQADVGLQKLAVSVDDLRPYWRELAQKLADKAQARWPLRQRSGKLRRSLTWAAGGLGRGGVFESDPNRLRFGSAVFYSRFAQSGTRKQQRTPLIHIDPDLHAAELSGWLGARASASGLEVT